MEIKVGSILKFSDDQWAIYAGCGRIVHSVKNECGGFIYTHTVKLTPMSKITESLATVEETEDPYNVLEKALVELGNPTSKDSFRFVENCRKGRNNRCLKVLTVLLLVWLSVYKDTWKTCFNILEEYKIVFIIGFTIFFLLGATVCVLIMPYDSFVKPSKKSIVFGKVSSLLATTFIFIGLTYRVIIQACLNTLEECQTVAQVTFLSFIVLILILICINKVLL